MRIVRFSIDGFGLYSGQSMDLSPGLTIFLGDNEAGKSTLLGFIRYVLFGFQKFARNANQYPPLAGGKHGGYLTVETGTGHEYKLDRHGKGGALDITPLRKAPRTTDSELLGGTSLDLFKNVYAFSLAELQDLKTLDTGSIKTVLYAASMGAGIQALPKAQALFDDRAKQLLSVNPKPIAIKLQDLEQKRMQLDERLGTVTDYDKTGRLLKDVEDEISHQAATINYGRERIAWIDLTLSALDTWQEWQECCWRMHDLPTDLEGFPANGLSRLESLNALLEQARGDSGKAASNLERLRLERSEAGREDRILGVAAAIESLRDGRNAYQEDERALAGFQAAEADGRRQVDDLLSSLSVGWTIERVESSRSLPSRRSEVMDRRDRLSATSITCDEKNRAVEPYKAQVVAARQAVASAVAGVKAIIVPDVEEEAEASLQGLQMGHGRFSSQASEQNRLLQEISEEQAALEADLLKRCPNWTETTLNTFNAEDAAVSLESAKREYLRASQDLMEARAELEASQGGDQDPVQHQTILQSKLLEVLGRLGEDWSLERLEASHGMVESQADVLALRDRRTKAAADHASASTALDPLKGPVEEALRRERESEDRLQAAPVAEEGLPAAPLLQGLRTGRGRFEAETEEQVSAARRLSDGESSIRKSLETLCPGWSFERLETFQFEKAQGALGVSQRRLTEQDERRAALRSELDSAMGAVRTADQGWLVARQQLTAIPPAGDWTSERLQTRAREISALRQRLSERDAAETEAAHLQQLENQARRSVEAHRDKGEVKAGSMLQGIGVGFVVTGLVVGGILAIVHSVTSGGMVGAILGVMGGILLIVHRAQNVGSVETGLPQLKRELEEHQSKTQEAATRRDSLTGSLDADCHRLNLPTPLTPSALERAEAEMRSLGQSLEDRSRAETDVEKQSATLELKRQSVRELEQRLETEKVEAGRLESEWQKELERQCLPVEWTPAEAAPGLVRLQALQEQLKGLEPTRQRLTVVCASTAEYRALAARAGIKAEDCKDLLQGVQEVLVRQDRAVEIGRDRGELERELESRRRLRIDHECRLKEAQERVEQAASSVQQAESLWLDWLASQALSPKLRPDDVLGLIETVKKGIQLLRDRQQASGQVSRVETSTQSVSECQAALVLARERWAEALRSLELPEELDPSDAQPMIVSLQALQDRAVQQAGRRRKQADLENALAAYRALAAQVGLEATSPAELLAAVDAWVASVDQARELRHQREKATTGLEQYKQNLAQAEEGLQGSLTGLKDAEAARDSARQDWEGWLRENEFLPDTSAEHVLEQIDRLVEAIQALDELEKVGRLQKVAGERLSRYRVDLETLLRALDLSPTRDVSAQVGELDETLKSARDAAVRQKGLTTQIEQALKEEQNTQARLAEITSERAALLSSAGCEDEATFRRKEETVRESAELHKQRQALESALCSVTNVANVDDLKERFQGQERDGLVEEREQRQLGIQGLQAQMEANRQLKAQYELQLRRLASSDDVARLRSNQEALRAELGDLARQWATWAVAKALLTEAAHRFEREAQPQVLLDAGAFFTNMTNRAYTKILPPLPPERKEFEVVAADGSRKTVDKLSGGAQEQLYLCLRFGFITHQRQVADSLPVVMDDVLVNFDPKRAARAASTIVKLAEDQQVLFFTCHPETVERFVELAPDVPVVEVEGGRIRAIV